jgi:MoxR-like ATPase
LAKTIARSLGCTFKRIQFTPDLLPSDVTGIYFYNQKQQEFVFRPGPIFSQILLADEINRATPRTQSSLLEAMQERNVTAAGEEYKLELPFFVLATQNPIEQEGTYPLPEAQLDRFMFNIWMDYPGYEEEIEVVKKTTSGKEKELDKILQAKDILAFQEAIRKIPVPDNVVEYAVNLVHKTRPEGDKAPEIVQQYISWGAGPRASQFLILGAKCNAAINGKYSPDIEDVQAIATPVLRHRIVRNYRAEAEGISIENIVSKLK